MSLTQLETATGSKFPETLTECRHLLGDCVNEARTLSHLLHPPLLDEVGFASAATNYAQEFARRSGIEIDISVDLPNRLQADTEILLFRVLQESLTNIHRHSGSESAVIRLARDAENILLEVQDQGQGMSLERLAEIQSQSSGVGIRGMRERIRQFEGDLTIESNESGTKISVTLPVPESYASSEQSTLEEASHARIAS